MLNVKGERERRETNGKYRIGETLHLEHVHFSSHSIFRAQGSEAYAKNASAGLLNAYSRTLALSCKVLWVVAMASEGGGEDGARGVHEVRAEGRGEG